MQLLSNLLHSIRHVERTANRLNSVHLSLSVLEDRVQPSTSPVDLGAAGDYAVLGLRSTYIENQQSLIGGDVGVSQRGGIRNEVHSSIQGDLDVWSRSQYSGRGKVSGTLAVNQAQLTNADRDALDASAAASALKATQTFRRIDRNTTVRGNGDLNVISVRGDVTETLTLRGSANDVFIVNIEGDLRLRGRESVSLAGGVTAANVILNFTGRRGFVSAQNGAINGTILAPRYSVHLHGSTVNGEIIAGGEEIDLQHNSHVNFVSFGGGQSNPPPATGATFSGFIYDDTLVNWNGLMDPGEEKAGATVWLINTDDGTTLSAVSKADGSFSIANVGHGTYTLSAPNFFGIATVGTVNGNADDGLATPNGVVGIVLADGDTAVGYSLGSRPNE